MDRKVYVPVGYHKGVSLVEVVGKRPLVWFPNEKVTRKGFNSVVIFLGSLFPRLSQQKR